MIKINQEEYMSLGVLQMAKMAYDAHWPFEWNTLIDYENQFDFFLELLDTLCDDITELEWEKRRQELADAGEDVSDFEYEGSAVFQYSSREMDQYLDLCRMFGRDKNIPWNENPYVQNAVQCVESAMKQIYDYCFSFWIELSPDQIEIKFEIDFYNGFEQTNLVLYALYTISHFFQSQVQDMNHQQPEERSAA